MNAVKWALGLGVGAVVLSKIFSSSTGSTPLVKTVPPKDEPPPGIPPAVMRFEIKRDVIPLGTELPLTAFLTGDSLNVMMLDHDKNTEFPLALKVATVAKDGLDAVYNAPLGSFGDSFPEIGTHFIVMPRDVILRTPLAVVTPPPPGTPDTTHSLDADDVKYGPRAFALLAGFGSVDEFIAHNAGILADTIPGGALHPTLTPADIGTPGVYFTTDLVGHLVTPWVAGTVVNVKKAIGSSIVPGGLPLGTPPSKLPMPPSK